MKGHFRKSYNDESYFKKFSERRFTNQKKKPLERKTIRIENTAEII